MQIYIVGDSKRAFSIYLAMNVCIYAREIPEQTVLFHHRRQIPFRLKSNASPSDSPSTLVSPDFTSFVSRCLCHLRPFTIAAVRSRGIRRFASDVQPSLPLELFSRMPTSDESAWPPYTRDQPRYFILDAEKKDFGQGPRTTACAFWNDFLPRLRGIPGTYKRENGSFHEESSTLISSRLIERS